MESLPDPGRRSPQSSFRAAGEAIVALESHLRRVSGDLRSRLSAAADGARLHVHLPNPNTAGTCAGSSRDADSSRIRELGASLRSLLAAETELKRAEVRFVGVAGLTDASVSSEGRMLLDKRVQATYASPEINLKCRLTGKYHKKGILSLQQHADVVTGIGDRNLIAHTFQGDGRGFISHSHALNGIDFPSENVEDDPRSDKCQAECDIATIPTAEKATLSVLKSALAGGLSCALSTMIMHPVDTIKTCVQASTTISFAEILSKLPQVGLRGLYKGSIPAIAGQFSSHGLRTGLTDASRLMMVYVAPQLSEMQVQSLASFCGTILGTASRIPCEVLKQRLQAEIFNNVGQAFVATLHEDGVRGFFRGTKPTLIREVPFYVAGTALYDEAKKVAQKLIGRELEPWEAMVVGALSGGLTAVGTTPVDVVKTRMMTAPQGLSVSMSSVATAILREEGPLGLFKGAVPRFFWVAPLGAINFAGYELIRKLLDRV